jgi:hypothetical protein
MMGSMAPTSLRFARLARSLAERPWPAVVADMVEGVVTANRLTGVRADHVRAGLWQVAEQVSDLAA